MIPRKFEEEVPLGVELMTLVEPLRACSELVLDHGAYLLGVVEILGVNHHIEAIAVTWSPIGEMIAVDPNYEALLTALYTETGAGSPFETVEIDEREYVLVVTPFAS